MKLAVITTHPIQYNAPVFRKLAERGKVAVKVFYSWGESAIVSKFDPGFDKIITWDIPLLSGYEHQFIRNTARKPGSDHFLGIVNPTLSNEVHGWKPDAVLVYGWNFYSHLKTIKYFKGKVPVFFRGDSTLLDEAEGFSFKKFFRRQILKWVYSKIDFALYVGKDNKDYFSAHGLKNEQLVYCPHSIDNDRFSKDEITYSADLSELRRELKIGKDNFVFLFVGKLIAKKNVEFLLNAFLKMSCQNCNILIVGNGVLEAELKGKFGHKVGVHFLNFQNQSRMPLIYRVANVMVLPSKYNETWGLAANEAMASGCSVIMSDKCGGAKDLIIDGKNGFKYKATSIDDLVQKMDLMVNLDLEEMSLFSRKHIQNFSIESVCEKMENAFGVLKKE